MDEREAIELYNRAGDAANRGLGAIHWPHVSMEPATLARLVEAVLDERCDWARLAFGETFEAEALGERLSEAWRTDAVQVRFAPEGVFVRASFTVRVEVEPEEDDVQDKETDPPLVEVLTATAEICLSFTPRHHVRPFVDFMDGEIRRTGDAAAVRLDPFAREVSPIDAVAWGLQEAGAG